MRSCTAFAPSSTANLGPGYDVFGLGLEPLGDKVRIARASGPSKRITIKNVGEGSKTIPCEAEQHSAGRVIKRMAAEFDIEDALHVTVTKGVIPGSGMGSSAASAAAAAVAFNKLYGLRLKKEDLVEYAAEGEIASAGTKHYDNVSASVLGGFVVVRTSPTLQFIRIAPPQDLVLVVGVPLNEVPKRKTEFARSVLPQHVPLASVVHNVAHASTIVAGFVTKDVHTIAEGISDIIVEPVRKELIPGYSLVRSKALEAGALAVTISGAGPAMISFLKTKRNGRRVSKAMVQGFREAGVESRVFVCRPSRGARVLGYL
jgi:homoserine kinase